MPHNQVRYPGTRPFTDAEKPLFFGREEEADNLSKLILLERLVVFFGKSGYGKTSLLNARILPYLTQEKNFKCFVIRVFDYNSHEQNSLHKAVRQTLQSGLNLPKLPGATDDGSIAYTLRQIQEATGLHRFFLTFDQVEEIFDYPPKEIARLGRELSELIHAETQMTSDSKAGSSTRQLDVRLLFSIRDDRLSYLDRFGTYLPGIFKNTCDLRPLTEAQASEAITIPALYARGDFSFRCPRFYYADEALKIMLDFLSDQGKSPIESFQLQIICSHLENKISADPEAFRNEEGQIEVQPKHLDRLKEIYENYYSDILKTLSNKNEIPKVRLMVEEGLIFKERRLTMDGELLESMYQVSRQSLNEMVSAHLLRSEQNSSGKYSYEIAHDTLVHPVLAAKHKREQEEAVDQKTKQLQTEVQKAWKKRFQALSVAIGMSVIAAVLAWQGYDLARQKKKADDLVKTLKKERETSDSLRVIAETERNRLLASEHIKKAKGYLSLPIPNHKAALQEYLIANSIDPTDSMTVERIASLRKLLNQ